MKGTQAGAEPGAAAALPDRASDLALWLRTQALLLGAHRFELLDVNDLAREVELLARRAHNELRERLRVVCVQLLKCRYQPGRPRDDWLVILDDERERIADLIGDSPSLAGYLSDYAERAYRSAVPVTARETGLPFSTFPQSNPFSAAELLGAAESP